MLNWYDTTLSDRYKLIDYHDSDNMAKVVEPINYFTNVSIPVFVGNDTYIIYSHLKGCGANSRTNIGTDYPLKVYN